MATTRKRTTEPTPADQAAQEAVLVDAIAQGDGIASTRAKKKTTSGSGKSGAKKKTTGASPDNAISAQDEADALKSALAAQGFVLGGIPRQTLPVNANVLGVLPWAFLPRRQYQDMDLTSIVPGSFSPQQLMELLADAEGNVSLALWNMVRLGAAEYRYEVRTPDNTEEDAEGKATLDEILGRVNADWGGFDALIDQWFMSAILEGAVAGEAIPNEAIDDVLDIVTVQPWTVYFQRDILQNYVAFQWQPMLAAGSAGSGNTYTEQPGTHILTPNPSSPPPASAELLTMRALSHGGFRELNENTFGYVPLDAFTDDPYGRMPFAPVMQDIMFHAQILKDLRQWSHVNAFGRLNISVLRAMVDDLMPPAVKANPAEKAKWLNKYLGGIQTAYNNLNPDDTFVHWDNVKIEGVDSAGQTFNVDNLIRVIERKLFRDLKQLPILMGSNEGTTETWGTLQMEVYALGIASVQRVVASLVEKLLNVALRICGRTSRVQFEFIKLRTSDRIKAATAEKLEIANAAAKRDEGWVTQDEAAIEVTGSEAVADAPQPDNPFLPLQPDAGSDQQPAEQAPDETNPSGGEQDSGEKAESDGAEDGSDSDGATSDANKDTSKEAEHKDEDAKKAAAKKDGKNASDGTQTRLGSHDTQGRAAGGQVPTPIDSKLRRKRAVRRGHVRRT